MLVLRLSMKAMERLQDVLIACNVGSVGRMI